MLDFGFRVEGCRGSATFTDAQLLAKEPVHAPRSHRGNGERSPPIPLTPCYLPLPPIMLPPPSCGACPLCSAHAPGPPLWCGRGFYFGLFNPPRPAVVWWWVLGYLTPLCPSVMWCGVVVGCGFQVSCLTFLPSRGFVVVGVGLGFRVCTRAPPCGVGGGVVLGL